MYLNISLPHTLLRCYYNVYTTSSSSKFIDMFANSAANNDLKEVAVGADGKDESVTVRGISLDEI